MYVCTSSDRVVSEAFHHRPGHSAISEAFELSAAVGWNKMDDGDWPDVGLVLLGFKLNSLEGGRPVCLSLFSLSLSLSLARSLVSSLSLSMTEQNARTTKQQSKSPAIATEETEETFHASD